MENITPTMLLLWDVKRSLEKGFSVSKGIKTFIDRDLAHPFVQEVRKWHILLQTDPETRPALKLAPSKRHLLALLEQGLRGQTILEALLSYEAELLLSCEEEIQRHIAKLPLLLLVPLMGLIFPALMILLIGPLLKMIEL
ncbi:MAG: hypothetical protein A2622_04785 [Bdellovibrionales bacterium RIFCSPHIGHO2_01_FULL_40_29]|nr:MAG: hypothetical protein A2622_04785 [Bdellovibrionales bacterium RIFCSPHIGHO2_01_FULL_40_29]OFZ34751.1 MAG: hypothetical protein A3D17_10585 [Bdellovibrionales bacterium RIFCSPHIGHO2_02_FULL_40_15]